MCKSTALLSACSINNLYTKKHTMNNMRELVKVMKFNTKLYLKTISGSAVYLKDTRQHSVSPIGYRADVVSTISLYN